MEGITSTGGEKKKDGDADAICDFYDLHTRTVACAPNDICKILHGTSGEGGRGGKKYGDLAQFS